MVRRLDAFNDRGRSYGFLVFLALALGLVFPYFESTRNANERPRLLQAMALWDTGTFAIDGAGGRHIDAGPDVARSKVDDRLYPNKPPGATVVIAAAYGVARAVHGDDLDLRTFTWWARIFSGWLPTMLLCVFMLDRLTRAFSREPAIAAVSLYALGTPAASYAHLAYGHQLAAALLVAGIALLVDAVTLDPGLARERTWRALVGGVLAGSAVTVEYGAVFAGLPIGIVLLLRARDRQRLPPVLLAIAGAAIPIALLAAYHDAVFGSPRSTGYHHVTHAAFAEKHGQGLLGLGVPTWDAFHTHFLSADAGLLAWAPLTVLAIYGLVTASGHADDPTRTEARVYLATFLLYAVIVSGLSFAGGWRVGPRYLVAVLPMLALGFAEAIGQVRNRPLWLATVVAFGLYGIIVNTMAANLWPHFDVDNINHPVGEVLLPLWERGLEPHSLPRAWLHVDAVHAVIVVTVAGGGLALARPIELMPSTVGALAFGVAVALLLVVWTQRWPPHDKGERNLAYIVRSWEPTPGERTPARTVELPPLPPGAK
jgi:hypothetical protein